MYLHAESEKTAGRPGRAAAALKRPDVQLVFCGQRHGRRAPGREGGQPPRSLDARRASRASSRTLPLLALADADIVVYPSRDEAFGLVPLEALQAGTPVVVCNDSGCGEIISGIDGGLLVPRRGCRGAVGRIAAVLATSPGGAQPRRGPGRSRAALPP